MNIADFKTLPIMGILRGVEAAIIPELTETVIDAGLRTVEITMNTPGAADLIRQMVQSAPGRLMVGAGTVLSLADLDAAVAAGAGFIVSPVLVPEVVAACVRQGIPVFPGALTPQEIFAAWQAGATMVKVFPAKFFGPVYFKEIKGPFADVELLACGGVNPQTIRAFFDHGANAAAFGGGIFRPEWLNPAGLPRIRAAIQDLLTAYRGPSPS